MAELIVEHRGSTTWITLNRPDARNALSRDLNLQLQELAAELEDRHDVRAIVITGAGDKAFCAGADLKERRGVSAEETGPYINAIAGAIGAWAESHKATIRSHTRASSQPPPRAKPETAAISGVLMAASRRQKDAAGWRSDSSKVRSRSERMSAPAANTSSEPAMTTQRISGSASNPSIAVASSSISSGDSALRASGRFRRQRATWPSRLVSTRPLVTGRARS